MSHDRPPTTSREGPLGLAGWLGVLAILVLVDVVVRQVYAPTWLFRIGATDTGALHDVTFGQDLSIVFDLAERRIRAAPHTLALVGDSTIMGDLVAVRERFAPELEREIAATRDRANPVMVIELGFLGLTTPDASLVIAKALALGSDLVVYAVTPRVICTLPFSATDAVRYALDPGVPSRLGPTFLLREFSVASLAESAVNAHWTLFRYRREIRDGILRTVARQVPDAWQSSIAPEPHRADLRADGPPSLTGPMWTHASCELSDDSREMVALRRILEMCAAERRCALYHGPINPEGLGNFEPGLLSTFRDRVARLAAEHGVPFHDYAEALPAARFRPRYLGRADAIHLEASGRTWLAKRLAADVQPLIPNTMR